MRGRCWLPCSIRSVSPYLVVLAAAMACLVWLLDADAALALDLVVDRTDDTAVATACTAAANDCSLRGAILRANAVSGSHTITVPAGTFLLNTGGVDEDAALTGDLDILQDITITGAGGRGVSGPTSTNIEGAVTPSADRDRIFHVLPSGNLTLREVTVRHGGPNPSPVIGGGIFAEGTLTLEHVNVQDNFGGTGGGGVAMYNSAVIRDSIIRQNHADYGAGLYVGGVAPSTVTITNTIISENRAFVSGGGINFEHASADALVTLNNVTVVRNRALGASGDGGGLRRSAQGTLRVSNTIVVSNDSQTMAAFQCSGTITSGGYNLLHSNTDECGMSVASHDTIEFSGNPLLVGDDYYGGDTDTTILALGSAALDRGNPAPPGSGGGACEANDMRGLTRLVDGDHDGVPRCDVGAVEGGRWYVVDTTTDSNAPTFQACDTHLTTPNCSLRGAITDANPSAIRGPLPGVITLPATGTGNPYRLTLAGIKEDNNATGDLDVRTDIAIIGGGAATTFIQAGPSPGAGLDRVFDVLGGTLALDGVTVRHGTGAPGGPSSPSDTGGGLKIRSGARAVLVDVHVTGNRAVFAGGIENVGTLAVFRSALTANTSTGGGDGGSALYTGAAGSSSLTNVTIVGNTSGNSGALTQDSTAATTLNNVTLVGNQTSVFQVGGGIVVRAGIVSVANSVIAQNRYGTTPTNCAVVGGAIVSAGFNLTDTTECAFHASGDWVVQDAGLGPLGDHGGQTPTLALLSASRAIDAGNTAPPGSGGSACAAVDQRGVPRPIDGEGVNGPRCDIGAYEAALCTTRPANVGIGVLPGQPGRIQVTITASSGNIQELRLHALPASNILATIGGQERSGDFVVPINATTAQFSLRRANGTGAGTLTFEVVDDCGVWKTLAGGGPSAWGGGSAPSVGPAGGQAAPVTSAPVSPTPTPSPTSEQRPRPDTQFER